MAIIAKRNWDKKMAKLYWNPCPNIDGIANANCDKVKEPNNPERVFLGLHLLKGGPLKILPNR